MIWWFVFPRDGVLELMRDATNRVVIVAPYMKFPTIHRLLDAIPDTVSECICITRWLPEDIASGVCDLEIFDYLAQARGGRLLVHPHLHAKYYSNGSQSLVGFRQSHGARPLAGTRRPMLNCLLGCPPIFVG